MNSRSWQSMPTAALSAGNVSPCSQPTGPQNDPRQARTPWLCRRAADSDSAGLCGPPRWGRRLVLGANGRFVKTDNAHANGDLLQISPHVGAIVVKVLVDARLGTVLIDLSTV